MSGKKKSAFITQDSVPDDHFVDTFGNGVNRKIPAPKFFEQIRKNQQTFIYESVEDLQGANLKANPDDPVYVRVAETGFWLYRITSLAATALDIELENGTTATRVYEETAVIPLPDITSLSSLNTAALVDGQQFSVGSYLPDTSTGSCLLRWRPDLPKSRHDGVLFFSLTVPMFTGTDTADYRNGVGETDSGGNGVMELVRGEIIYDAVIRVPTVDPDWQVALDRFSDIVGVNNVQKTIFMESGHLIPRGLLVVGGDHSDVRIGAGENPILLDPDFVPVKGEGVTGTGGEIIAGSRTIMPSLNCRIDAQDRFGTGYWLSESVGHVRTGYGVINAGENGFYLVLNSRAQMHGTDFSGSGSGNRVSTGCQATLQSANLSGVKNATGFHGPASGLDVTRGAVVYADNIDASNCAGRGLNVRRAWVSCGYADLSGCGEYAAIIQRGGFANLEASDLSGFGLSALSINSGATVNLSGANTGSGVGNPNPADTTIPMFNIPFKQGTVYANEYPEGFVSGVFTPVIEGSTTAGAHTYATQYGRYERVGNTVTVEIEVALSAFDSSADGSLLIKGVPVPPRRSLSAGVSIGRISNVSIPGNAIQITALASTDGISVAYVRSGLTSPGLPISNLTDTSSFRFSYSYHANVMTV